MKKVETDYIVSITASATSSDTSDNDIFETFKTDVIIFIGNVIMCVGVTLTDIFQYQSQLC